MRPRVAVIARWHRLRRGRVLVSDRIRGARLAAWQREWASPIRSARSGLAALPSNAGTPRLPAAAQGHALGKAGKTRLDSSAALRMKRVEMLAA